MFVKQFEQFDLDNLLSHVKETIPASDDDKKTFQHLKHNIDKYISVPENRQLFLDGFDFLESPIIIDNFKDQIERRQWLKELEAYPEIRAEMQKNRLRVNRLSAINRLIAMPHFFLDDLNKPVPIISDRAEMNINYLKEYYQDETLKKKIDFANSSASLARLFIKEMIK